jgi:hypothetical protein
VSQHASNRPVGEPVAEDKATIGLPGSQIGFSHSLS